MTVVANFFSSLLKSIPVLIAKVGTVLLFIFTVGMLAGYALALGNVSPLVFLVPAIAMAIMWYKLDEGFLVLLVLTALVVFFPDLANTVVSSIF